MLAPLSRLCEMRPVPGRIVSRTKSSVYFLLTMVVYRYIWKYTWKLDTRQHIENSTQGKVATAARSEHLLTHVGNYVPACEGVAIEAQPEDAENGGVPRHVPTVHLLVSVVNPEREGGRAMQRTMWSALLLVLLLLPLAAYANDELLR